MAIIVAPWLIDQPIWNLLIILLIQSWIPIKYLKKGEKKEKEEENKKENDINNRALDLALDYFSCKKLKLVNNKVSFLLTYKIHK